MEKANCSISSALSTFFTKEKNNILNDYSYTYTNEYFPEKNLTFNPILIEEWKIVNQNFDQVAYRYLTVKKEKKAVLVAYFQIFDLTYKNFNSFSANTILKQILKYFLICKQVKILILGNVLRTNQPSYLYDNELLSPQKAISLLTACIEDIAKEENISATILKEIADGIVLQIPDYLSPLQDVVMSVEILPDWKKFEDYQAAITRKYASRAKKIRKSLLDLKIDNLSANEIAKHLAIIFELFNQILSKQALVMGKLKPDYFHALKSLHKDNFEFYTFSIAGEIVAFYSAFVTETSYDVYYVGYDQRLNAAYNLYFNILFSSLERAIILGKQTLNLGRTSLDAKSNLGAKPTVLNAYIKLHNTPQWLLEQFVKYFSTIESPQWKERNPLKQSVENVVEVDAFV